MFIFFLFQNTFYTQRNKDFAWKTENKEKSRREFSIINEIITLRGNGKIRNLIEKIALFASQGKKEEEKTVDFSENEVRIFRNRKNGTQSKIRHKSDVVNEITRGSGRKMNKHLEKRERERKRERKKTQDDLKFAIAFSRKLLWLELVKIVSRILHLFSALTSRFFSLSSSSSFSFSLFISVSLYIYFVLYTPVRECVSAKWSLNEHNGCDDPNWEKRILLYKAKLWWSIKNSSRLF